MNTIIPTTELVINWHITEACNYSCQYCYAHWCKSRQKELIHNKQQTKQLLKELYDSLKPESSNILTPYMRWSSIRLNIAGGEPLLYPNQVLFIAESALELGMSVSLISNGSLLSNELMDKIASKLVLLGLSCDSDNTDNNRIIGRSDHKGQQLIVDDLHRIINSGRKINPKMRLKLNTVVNSVNYLDDMSGIVKLLNPDRWKVLKMLPVINSDLAISDRQFNEFINKHSSLKEIMRAEDNDEMSESYIMIDPLGRFFQNSPDSSGKGYIYSSSIIDTGAISALKEINFSPEKFLSRYKEVIA
ncbi:viperin family antiviral radical SAM protein [Zhongshania sp.]|jgi:radical S-adenosyl methionine domain-containing protein 2|uniref:viperin family antiviral radical SAM protein n=1 Tax=Zhongshania sp. TaxID=1971902 RepID=UPI0039E4F7E8